LGVGIRRDGRPRRTPASPGVRQAVLPDNCASEAGQSVPLYAGSTEVLSCQVKSHFVV